MKRSVTIVVHTDGELGSRQIRLPLWAFSAGKWAALVVGLAVVLFFAFAGPITRNALRVPGLERQIAQLQEENGRVQQLAAALNRAEANYQAMRQLLGIRAPADTGRRGAGDMRALPLQAAQPGRSIVYEAGASPPSHWPLEVHEFVTRGQVESGDSELHEGIDLAAAVGTPIRAAGGGTVSAAGLDQDYGLFVLLRHPDGYESMYGHASRLLVREGDEVNAGQVIAVTGNSGRSTAPHLHFEIRREGRSIDPLTLLKEGT